MPITKEQDEVPGTSEQVAVMQSRIDELEKENRQLRDQLAGNVPQASSAALHNYPDATIPIVRPEAEPPSPISEGAQQPAPRPEPRPEPEQHKKAAHHKDRR